MVALNVADQASCGPEAAISTNCSVEAATFVEYKKETSYSMTNERERYLPTVKLQ